MFRSSKENAGALPQTPPGRMILPGPHPFQMLQNIFPKLCTAAANGTKNRRSRAGWLCRPACAHAHRKKTGDFREKQARLFSRKSPAFSVARELSCHPESFRRILSVFQVFLIARTGPGTGGPWFRGLGAEEAPSSLLPGSLPGDLNSFRRILSVIPSVPHRQGGSRDNVPGSGVRGLKKPPHLRTPGILQPFSSSIARASMQVSVILTPGCRSRLWICSGDILKEAISS